MAETAGTMRAVLDQSGYLLDPHTATAMRVARQIDDGHCPMIVLATAHPAKFPEAVKEATGLRPTLPSRLAGLMDQEEKYEILAPESEAVEDYVGRHTRAVG